METLSDRIHFILKETGLSLESFGRRIGVTKAAVSKWRSGQIVNLKMEHLFRIEDEFGYCARWVGIGDGPKRMIKLQEKTPVYADTTRAICEIVELLDEDSKRSVQESAEKAKRIKDLENEVDLLKKAIEN